MRWFSGAVATAVAMALSASALAREPAPPPASNGAEEGPIAANHRPEAPHTTTPASSTGTKNAAAPVDLTRYNPDAVKGVLPNGLRYTVMRRGGARQASIILYLDVGSVNERADEQGVAHFLEHMAFNGSPNFPAETLPHIFAGIGVALGRDQNANTTVTATTYRLDLSEESDAKLDLSFKWLRDLADNLTIGEDQVERERGVILSEYNASLGPMATLADKTSGFLAPSSLGVNRDPIGTPEAIRTMTAARVRGFYERWYRPDNAVIVVVADAPTAELEARVKDTFGSWKATGLKPAKPDPGHLDKTRPSDVIAISDSHWPDTVQVCRGGDPDPPQVEGVTTRVRDLEDVAWSMALKNRLERLAGSGNPPFVAASVDTSNLFDTMQFTCMSAYVRDGDWRRAVKTVSDESRRMDLYGVTEQETKSAMTEIRGMLDASAGIADTQPAAALADIILRNYVNGGTFSTAREDVRIGTMAMARITAKSVGDGFRRRWTNVGQPLVVLTSSVPIDTAQVRTVWTTAQSGPAPAALPERGELKWAYKTFGPKGKIVERTVDEANDLVRLKFANGLRVTFKQTENASDRVEVRIRFGHGQQDIPAAQSGVATLGSQMMQWGGLGKNTYDDTVTLCEGHLCDVGFGIDRDSFLLSGTTRPGDLDVELQLLTAYLVDPGFSADVNPRIPSAVNAMNRVLVTDPGTQARKALGAAMLAPHVADEPKPDVLMQARAADFAKLLKPAMTRDALEVTIIGDIDEEKAMDLVASTLGALPPRTAGRTAPAGAAAARYPVDSPVIRVTHEGDPDKAVVLVTWPVFVFTPEKVHDGRVLDLLSDMLQNAVLESIRETLGASYSPQVGADLSKGGDQGAITAEIETTPAATEQVLDTVRQIAKQYAAGEFDADALERVRKPRLARGGIRESTNDWWVAVLDGSWAHPDQLTSAATWEADYKGVTLDEVKAAAKQWLSRAPVVVVATPRAAATRVAGAGAPH